MRPEKRRNSEKRKQRKNPVASSFLPMPELKRMAGKLAIDAVLSGCSFEEDVLLAAIIPELLRIIRTTGLSDPKEFPAVNIDITGEGPVITVQRAATPGPRETEETPNQ